ncbi:MAG: hypothetical protein AB4368_00280 [Xenococcaceae cyanobacterium]
MYFLAQTQLFEKGINAAISISDSWDETWRDVLSGSGVAERTLYGELARLGELFAVGTLLFLMISFVKKLNNGDYSALASLLLPIIVSYLLFNNGSNLANFTLALRDTINTFERQILVKTSRGVRLDEIFRQAQGLTSTQEQISSWIKQCEALSGDKQTQCLDEAVTQSEDLLRGYQGIFGISQWSRNRLNDLNQLRIAITNEPLSLFSLDSPLIWTVIGSSAESLTYTILIGLQMAFQNAVEISMLLTALFGPIAVGGSLLPVDWAALPVCAWLTGFLSIGMLKLGFNIVAGLSAVVFVNAESTDALWFPIFLGIFAPILASGIAVGGGLAVWSSLTSIASSAIGTLSLGYIKT